MQPNQYTYQVYDTATVQPEVQSPTRKYGFSFVDGDLATEPPPTTVNPYTYKVENNPTTVHPNLKKYGFDSYERTLMNISFQIFNLAL